MPKKNPQRLALIFGQAVCLGIGIVMFSRAHYLETLAFLGATTPIALWLGAIIPRNGAR